VLAGLIIAVAGQPILSSIVVMADMPALFWAALAVWLVVQVGANPCGRPAGADARPCPYSVFWFLGAGAALAMAIISRWLYLLMVIPLGLYVLFQVLQKKLIWWQIWPAVVSGSIVLAPQVWLSLNKPEGLFHSWLLGWNLTNFFQREFENIDGHFIYQLPNAIFYAQPAGHPAYIFPLLGLAGLWGLWRLWQIRHWETLILLLGWILPSYLFLAGIPYQNFRFGLTHYLPLVLLTGFGLSDLLNTAIKRQGGRGAEEQGRKYALAPLPPYSPAVLKITIALSLVSMLAWAYPMLNSFLTSQNQSKVIARQVEQNLPPQATLITFGLTLTMQHYSPLNTIEIFHQDPASLQKMTETHTPLYLLLDVNSIQTQWEGKTPQLNYQWLEENMILQKVGAFPPYTLFKISKPE
jgi:4-amino-4-deoxy-L-arabinose transferase-like glycosyltransferase